MSATPLPARGLPVLRIMLLALLVLSSATPATAADQTPVTGRLTLTGSNALRAFLDFARSAQGQAIAVKAGYVQYPENLP